MNDEIIKLGEEFGDTIAKLAGKAFQTGVNHERKTIHNFLMEYRETLNCDHQYVVDEIIKKINDRG